MKTCRNYFFVIVSINWSVIQWPSSNVRVGGSRRRRQMSPVVSVAGMVHAIWNRPICSVFDIICPVSFGYIGYLLFSDRIGMI